MSLIAWRAHSFIMSWVTLLGPRTSPAMTTRLVVQSVSTATRDSGSAARNASTTESEMRSQTLSGCPSDTLSLVNRYDFLDKAYPFDALGCPTKTTRRTCPCGEAGASGGGILVEGDRAVKRRLKGITRDRC